MAKKIKKSTKTAKGTLPLKDKIITEVIAITFFVVAIIIVISTISGNL